MVEDAAIDPAGRPVGAVNSQTAGRGGLDVAAVGGQGFLEGGGIERTFLLGDGVRLAAVSVGEFHADFPALEGNRAAEGVAGWSIAGVFGIDTRLDGGDTGGDVRHAEVGKVAADQHDGQADRGDLQPATDAVLWFFGAARCFLRGGGALQGFGNGFVLENGGWLGRDGDSVLFGRQVVWLDDTSRVMRRCGRDVASRSPDGLRLLGNASLSAHHGRVRFGPAITLGRLRLAGRRRCEFINVSAHRDGSVARDVGTAGQATLGV